LTVAVDRDGAASSGRVPLFQPHDVRSLRDRAYDDIREAILTGALPPGERIKERDVAAQMGISTTPVKEALRRLEQDGLVVSQPRRGAVVGPLVQTSPAEILQIRADLEGYAARLAAEKMSSTDKRTLAAELDALEALAVESPEDRAIVAEGTNAWHHSIRTGADNVFLERFLDTLAPFDRTIRVKSTLDPVEWALDREEHRQIMNAILAGDGESAERVMHDHIHRVIAFHARSSADSAPKRRTGKPR
jgi:DNA-binding GntR family transcriptional regulator